MPTYKVTGKRAVLDVEPGGELEHDFTEGEESDHLAAGRLEIVPRTYEVLAGVVHATKEGDKFEAAFRLHEERALIEAGAIAPVKKRAASAAKQGADASTKGGVTNG